MQAAKRCAILNCCSISPGQPWRITDYQAHKRHLDGLQRAANQRPPSWSGATALPGAGA
jgi:hypothetical protein